MKIKATKKTFRDVMLNIIVTFESASKDEKKFWIEELNKWLDELRDNDFFGTEGQNDPRGDNRD